MMRYFLITVLTVLGLVYCALVMYGQRGTWARPMWGIWYVMVAVSFVLAIFFFILGIADGVAWMIPAVVFLLATPLSERGRQAAKAYKDHYFPKES